MKLMPMSILHKRFLKVNFRENKIANKVPMA